VLVGRRGEKRHHPVYIDKEVDVAAANHCLAAGQFLIAGEDDRYCRLAVGGRLQCPWSPPLVAEGDVWLGGL